MAVLGTQAFEQFGRLGLPTEAISARLGELSPKRLRQLADLRSVDAQAALRTNHFAGDLGRAGPKIPRPFSNLRPSEAKAALAPLVDSTYARSEAIDHPSARDPLPHLLQRRGRRPATMTIALSRRPELRGRVGTSLGAVIANDGRTDGVISIERAPRSAPRSSPPLQGGFRPPGPDYRNASIWQVMMAMDQAILAEAARLGLGQGSGVGGTGGMMEAMGLWSLTPDDDDPSAWMGLGSAASAPGVQTAAMAGPAQRSPTGTEGPESQNSSLDVDVMRLKRMIDKKTQMMELYSQTLSKYNSSANAIIGNMKG